MRIFDLFSPYPLFFYFLFFHQQILATSWKFSPCSYNLQRYFKEHIDTSSFFLRCGFISVPLDYSKNSTLQSTITLSAYRIQIAPSSNTQLWVLPGGPGYSGLSLVPNLNRLLQFSSDIVLVDHRGTGSSAISCSKFHSPSSYGSRRRTSSEIRSCFYENLLNGIDFRLFTITAAAHDLHLMISSLLNENEEGTEIQLYAFSYGTTWAQRYLQIYGTSNIVKRIVLEGIFSTKYDDLNLFINGTETVGRRLIAKCIGNSKCASYFSDKINVKLDPLIFLHNVINFLFEQKESNPCTISWLGKNTKDLLYVGIRRIFGAGLFLGKRDFDEDYRVISLALLSRWIHCSMKSTTSEIQLFLSGISLLLSRQPDFKNTISSSLLILKESLLNELLYDIISYSELRKTIFHWPLSNFWPLDKDSFSLFPTWSSIKYPLDEFTDGSFSNLSVDILILNGELDPQTPFHQAIRLFDHLKLHVTGNVHFALIKDAGHNPSMERFECIGKPVVKEFLQGFGELPRSLTCAIILNKQSPNRTSLISKATLEYSTNFSFNATTSLKLFGIRNVWQDKVFVPMKNSTCPFPKTDCYRCFYYCSMMKNYKKESSNACGCMSILKTCILLNGNQFQLSALGHHKQPIFPACFSNERRSIKDLPNLILTGSPISPTLPTNETVTEATIYQVIMGSIFGLIVLSCWVYLLIINYRRRRKVRQRLANQQVPVMAEQELSLSTPNPLAAIPVAELEEQNSRNLHHVEVPFATATMIS